MNLDATRAIADAVLYEGFILYPYRPSSVKNQQRWTFGSLYPRAYTERIGGDACRQQIQCLVEGDAHTTLELRVRFLHLIERQAGAISPPLETLPEGCEPAFTPVACVQVDGRRHYTWQEAEERELILPAAGLGGLCAAPHSAAFELPGSRTLEPIRDAAGSVVGVLARTRRPLVIRVISSVEHLQGNLFRLTLVTENLTPFDPALAHGRDAATLYSLASTHAMLGVERGAFVSLIDPPGDCAEAAGACANLGAFPVLVGAEGTCDTLLASPIILYDYPQIAPESPGDLFDGTEIDEILTLRILAMSDAEKREMAAVDPRARHLLERTEALTPEQMQGLHGALRTLRPSLGMDAASAPVPRLAVLNLADRSLKVGDRVRLRPRKNAGGTGGDIFDLVLDGKTAIIEAIERDFEDRVHVAVAVEDDPGRDMGLARMPGHRFFFSSSEIELLEDA